MRRLFPFFRLALAPVYPTLRLISALPDLALVPPHPARRARFRALRASPHVPLSLCVSYCNVSLFAFTFALHEIEHALLRRCGGRGGGEQGGKGGKERKGRGPLAAAAFAQQKGRTQEAERCARARLQRKEQRQRGVEPEGGRARGRCDGQRSDGRRRRRVVAATVAAGVRVTARVQGRKTKGRRRKRYNWKEKATPLCRRNQSGDRDERRAGGDEEEKGSRALGRGKRRRCPRGAGFGDGTRTRRAELGGEPGALAGGLGARVADG